MEIGEEKERRRFTGTDGARYCLIVGAAGVALNRNDDNDKPQTVVMSWADAEAVWPEIREACKDWAPRR